MAQLFIGQLPFSKFFPGDLLNLFRPYGNVVAHQLHIRQGNAFVTYATTDEADAAIRALHGQCALGTRSQPIQVMYSKGTRLISPFGLQHRSLCLARNKDHQLNKESGSGGSHTNTTNSSNSDSVSLNRGTSLFGLSGTYNNECAAVIYSAGAEEASLHGASNVVGVTSFGSHGPSDAAFDEEGWQIMSSGVLSNTSVRSLNATGARQFQQQQQTCASGAMGLDSMMYGSSVKWAVSPPTMVMQTDHNHNNNGLQSPSSRLSSPAAPPLPPAVSYIVVPPFAQSMAAGFGVPAGVPVCYVMPSVTASSYLPQQMLSPPLACMQVRQM